MRNNDQADKSEEPLDVVNEKDLVLGQKPRLHCLKLGLLHRAIMVFVIDREGNVILQKRSKQKSWCPGYWTVSCTGHVRAGESYSAAAKRELKEELGLGGERPKELFKVLMPKYSFEEFTEWEYVTVFELVIPSSERIDFDKKEIETVKKVPKWDLLEMVEAKDGSMTPDAIENAGRYLALIKGH